MRRPRLPSEAEQADEAQSSSLPLLEAAGRASPLSGEVTRSKRQSPAQEAEERRKCVERSSSCRVCKLRALASAGCVRQRRSCGSGLAAPERTGGDTPKAVVGGGEPAEALSAWRTGAGDVRQAIRPSIKANMLSQCTAAHAYRQQSPKLCYASLHVFLSLPGTVGSSGQRLSVYGRLRPGGRFQLPPLPTWRPQKGEPLGSVAVPPATR